MNFCHPYIEECFPWPIMNPPELEESDSDAVVDVR